MNIREQLAKHRENETCAACHRKIDLFGFALENFYVIGSWRANYALGRAPELADRPVIYDIMKNVSSNKGGFKDLVRAVVLSESFAKN